MLSNPNLIFAYKTAHKIKDLIESLNFELDNNAILFYDESVGSMMNRFVLQGLDAVQYLKDLIYELEQLDKEGP